MAWSPRASVTTPGQQEASIYASGAKIYSSGPTGASV